jgi:hypothetical protein
VLHRSWTHYHIIVTISDMGMLDCTLDRGEGRSDNGHSVALPLQTITLRLAYCQ